MIETVVNVEGVFKNLKSTFQKYKFKKTNTCISSSWILDCPYKNLKALLESVLSQFKGDLVARMDILDEVVWNKFYGSGGVEDVGNRE